MAIDFDRSVMRQRWEQVRQFNPTQRRVSDEALAALDAFDAAEAERDALRSVLAELVSSVWLYHHSDGSGYLHAFSPEPLERARALLSEASAEKYHEKYHATQRRAAAEAERDALRARLGEAERLLAQGVGIHADGSRIVNPEVRAFLSDGAP